MMSMDSVIDYSTLNWVKEEIDETIKQARHSLEEYVENQDDVTQLRFCLTYIHQVYGTLQMVELYGASLFAEEMEQLIQALLDDEVSKKDDAYEVLMRAILQLPDYLEKIQGGMNDNPLILMPIMNDLRTARGVALLSENALFAPDLSDATRIELEHTTEFFGEDPKMVARKLRPIYQVGLLGWYRDDSTDESLQKIIKVLTQLEQVSSRNEVVRLWWVAKGVAESLLKGGLEANITLKLLLGQVDREIKRLIDTGEQELATNPAEELLKNLLYYVAHSKPVTQRIKEIKAKFNLAVVMDTGTDLESARATLAGPNAQLMETVSAAISEDLARVKDALDLLLRSEDRDISGLQAEIDILRKMADTLGMLGMGVPRKVIQEQVSVIEAMTRGEQEVDEAKLMEIAGALLFVESSLVGLVESSHAQEFNNTTEHASSDITLASGEMRQIQDAVLKEITVEIAKSKDAIIAFIDAPLDYDQLDVVPGLFETTQGSMRMIGLDHGADLVQAANEYITAELMARDRIPSQDELDNIADVISSIEYYLEAVRENRPNQDAILSVTRQGLAALGYQADSAFVDEPELEDFKPAAIDTSESVIDEDQEAMSKLSEEIDYESEAEILEELLQEPVSLLDIPEPEISDDVVEDEVDEIGLPEMPDMLPVTEEQEAVIESEPEKSTSESVSQSSMELPDDIDEDILEIFIEEAEEVLESIREHLPVWKQDYDNHDALVNIRRSFHTLKGSGRLVGAVTIGEFAWSIESMLNRILDGTITVNQSKMALIDDAVDALPAFIAELKGQGPSGVDVDALVSRAEAESLSVKPEPPESEEILIDEAKSASDRDEKARQEQTAQTQVMDPVLYEIFSKESKGHIEAVNEYLAAVSQREPQNCFVNDELLRALHTLHGSARMAGADDIAEVAGSYEKYAKILHENETIIDADCQALLAEGMQTIDNMLAIINQPDIPHVEIGGLLAKINGFYQQELQKQQERLDEVQQQAQLHVVEDDEITEEEEFDQEVVEIFIEEGAEILDSSEVIIQRLADNMEDAEAIVELQRELHTLKGGARMAGIVAIGDLSHAVESVLTAVAEEGLAVSEAMVNCLHRSIDKLSYMLDKAKNNQSMEPQQGLIDDLNRILNGEQPLIADDVEQVVIEDKTDALDSAEIIDLSDAIESTDLDSADESQLQESADAVELSTDEEASVGSSSESVEHAKDPDTILTELEALVAADRDSASSKDEAVAEPESIAESVETTQAAEEELEEDIVIPPPLADYKEEITRSSSSEMVRVRSDLLDNLVNYAGEVSIFRSRLEQQIGAFRYNLVEMDQTVDRLREQLRKLEIETEAQILFRYEQENVTNKNFDPLELDRYSTMQQLSRALMETTADIDSIQNLMDGLVRESETLMIQQARVNTDLQEGLMRTRMVSFSGVIPRLQRIMRQTTQELHKKARLNVSGEQDELDRNVLERITAPLEHMIRNALAHGIETPEARQAAGKPTTGTIDLAITREGSEVILTITDDGAGMNREAIRQKALERGLIEDDSRIRDADVLQFILESGFSTAEEVSQISGRGVGMDVVNSEIKQLGGTLQISSEEGKGSTFVVRLPLTLALNHALLVRVSDETYAIPLTSIEGIVRMSREELENYRGDASRLYEYAGSEYQVQSLGSILHAQYSGFESAEKLLPVLLVRSGDHQTALQVDALMGSREIVVKSVGPQLSTLRGVSGATILGDGSVVLILDMSSIIRLSAMRTSTEHAFVEAQSEEDRKLNVMVVDDSITVRKVTTRLLERNDMNVITAKDGVDAVAMLHEHIPDIMLLDIEMPRMDGFELATYMRNEPRLKDIPIIMITSRTGDKHRRRAEEIGVQRYLGKPYQEHDLLDNITSVIEEHHGIT